MHTIIQIHNNVLWAGSILHNILRIQYEWWSQLCELFVFYFFFQFFVNVVT